MSENVLSLVVVGGGLLAIALTLWFGLQSFKGGITEKLQKMSEDLTAIRTKQDALWDIVAAKAGPGWSGTVTRALPNLGQVEISANPKEAQTQYFVKVQHGTLSDALIELLAKRTGFHDYEQRTLNGQAASYLQVDKHALILNVPAVDPAVTTEFMSKFLEWLDSEYIEGREQALAEYEAPILPQRQD